jgi:hypothetical protein
MTDIDQPDADYKTAPIGPARLVNNEVTVRVRGYASASVRVDYTYSWEPTQDVMDEWTKEVNAAKKTLENQQADARSKFLREEFERQRQMLVAQSKVPARPAEDLRREEQHEVLSALISRLFERANGTDVSPLEIEYFHRYFEVDSLFTFAHPSWWAPRYWRRGDGRNQAYEVATDTEPAPMGSSLGWVLQLDGDGRRNEFLNSPWVRACIPMRPGREREAIAWLAAHVEGELGYDATADPLRSLLIDIEDFRADEAAAGPDGPEYATFGPHAMTVGDDDDIAAPVVPPGAAAYPIVAEFEVATPTEGFLYDDITLQVT